MGRRHRSKRQEREDLIKRLHRETHFSKKAVTNLLEKYAELDEKCGKKELEKDTFQDLLRVEFDMTDDVIMDRIFRTFNSNNNNRLCEEEFVKGMSVFLEGTLEEQMRFAFDVYDFNSDGYVTREEVFNMLKSSFINTKSIGDEDPDEGVKDLVDIVLKKLDFDNDFRISRADFESCVPKDELLLEFLGKCFPSPKTKRKFKRKTGLTEKDQEDAE